jgi:hypothetical protein
MLSRIIRILWSPSNQQGNGVGSNALAVVTLDMIEELVEKYFQPQGVRFAAEIAASEGTAGGVGTVGRAEDGASAKTSFPRQWRWRAFGEK